MNFSDLTIQEKMRLLAGKNFWQTDDLDGKLYTVSVSDGPVGVRKPYRSDEGSTATGDIPSVAYPSIQVLSQTWDTDLAREMGECLADDCIEKDVDVLLAPGINVKRSPICGRNFEYFSEDPYLTGIMAGEYISGIQSGHIGATVKHYFANNNEVGRLWASSNAEERVFREIYLRNFEIALKAKPWAIMSAYNFVNGILMSQNGKYLSVLRDDLGFKNDLVMSDWGAVKDHTASVKSGTDLEMPFNKEHLDKLIEDYNAGLVSETEIDACAERVFDFIKKAEEEAKKRKLTRTIEQRRAIACKIAREGVVLLKNNGVLPIKDGTSVSIVGRDPDHYYVGGGSAKVVPEKKPSTLKETLSKKLTNSKVFSENTDECSGAYIRSLGNATNCGVSIIVCGFEQGEGWDRPDIKLSGIDERLIKTFAAKNKNTVVVLYGGGVFDVSGWIDDVAAVVYVGYGGEMGAEAIADVLGGACPNGRLTETFAKSLSDYPSENIFFDGLNYNYTEGFDVGYRYFDKYPEKVRFPFGFGLSYTSFVYSDLFVSAGNGAVKVIFNVTNTGEYDGAAVPKVFVSESDPKVEKPVRELCGFKKVHLKKGETAKVEITLDDKAFSHWQSGGWTEDKGEYIVTIADDLRDVVLYATYIIN